jgi:hypothetical protein
MVERVARRRRLSLAATAALSRKEGHHRGSPRLAVIIWNILATGEPYHELGAGYFTRRLDPERETGRLIAKLEALGHTVTLQPAA